MKRNYLLLAITVLMAVMSCQKTFNDNQIVNDQLGNEVGLMNIVVDCTPITLSGTISTNTTLETGKTYLLDGVVDVKNATLTIEPGTLILARTSVSSALVIDQTAQINAVGTATNPIVFTSDKTPGTRSPGDWIGIVILGNAPNNQSNSLSFNIEGNSYTAGGSSPSSSAGNFEHIQVNFAGKGSSTGDRLTQSALVLGSIGSGMIIRDVQINNSLFDGLGVWGGTVGIKEVFSYKSQRTDFSISQGYRGNMQSLLGYKDDAVHHTIQSYGLDITNNLVGANNAPFTYPIISNLSLLGGSYCESGDTNFEDGIVIRLNGNAQIYNSVLEGFPQYGLLLFDDNIVGKTSAGTDPLIFSNNSIHDVNTPYDALVSVSWALANGCRDNSTNTMQDWIEGNLSIVSCGQTDNQFSLTSTGYYKNSLCGNKCSTFPNLYINESTYDLEAPEYGMLSGFFDQPEFRGGLQSQTDTWMLDTWIDFCAATRNYCSE